MNLCKIKQIYIVHILKDHVVQEQMNKIHIIFGTMILDKILKIIIKQK